MASNQQTSPVSIDNNQGASNQTTANSALAGDVSAGPPTLQLTAEEKTLSQRNLTNNTKFIRGAVKNMTAMDFDLSSKSGILLKWNDCRLILFYSENQESIALVNIWAEAAKQVAGPVFAGVNIMSERKVAEAFMNLNMKDHPLKWAALKQIPFIIVYRQGLPTAFYNGERNVQAIVDYSLTLACRSDYFEPVQVFGSTQVEDNFSMGGLTQYKHRTQSTQFTAANPVRKFNDKVGIVQAGSAKEKQIEQSLTTQEEQQEAATQQQLGVAGPGSVAAPAVLNTPQITTQPGTGPIESPTVQGGSGITVQNTPSSVSQLPSLSPGTTVAGP